MSLPFLLLKSTAKISGLGQGNILLASFPLVLTGV
jgi:hypothetical protein